jgi:hypothetical protein
MLRDRPLALHDWLKIKKTRAKWLSLSQTHTLVDADCLGVATLPKYCLTFLLER